MEARKMAEYKIEKKNAPEWGMMEVLGDTSEPGKPAGEKMGQWESKLLNREEKLKYLKESLRYWYAKEGFGSEKRKTPA
jgi:hypothetical protein